MNLNFEDGLQRVSINDDPNRVICWNPGDVNFIDRFLAFKSYVEDELRPKLVDILGTLAPDNEGNVLAYHSGEISKLSTEFNGKLNTAFGSDVATAAFQGASPFTPIPNGKLLFANFLDALGPLIDNQVVQFNRARAKYTGEFKDDRTASQST